MSTLPIPSQVLDPLSIAYFFRLGELKAETETTLPTCDGRKLKMIKVRTGKTEKIRVPAGTYKAMGTIPEMKDLSGVFKKSGGHSSYLVFRRLAEDPRKDQQQSSGGKLHRPACVSRGTQREVSKDGVLAFADRALH